MSLCMYCCCPLIVSIVSACYALHIAQYARRRPVLCFLHVDVGPLRGWMLWIRGRREHSVPPLRRIAAWRRAHSSTARATGMRGFNL